MNARCPVGALALVFGSVTLHAQLPAGPVPVEWNARNAEHLLNRAGFGAHPAEIESAVRTGHEAYVQQLLDGFGSERSSYVMDLPPRPKHPKKMGMDVVARIELKQQVKRDSREQLGHFAGWCFGRMIAGHDPLRERMTLFWHGHFTSAYRDVKEVLPLVEQNELFRRHALGNFGELTRAIVHDHAMIRYLDNDKYEKDSPNENMARELMELFTLGEGNYSEEDVREAARALTGYSFYLATGVHYSDDLHDKGEKTILGERACFDADGLVDLLLEQPACPRFIAWKLLTYFEGREPSDERLTSYAIRLRETDYEIAPFLGRLFLDPEFYSDEVIGNKVAAPIELVVANSRRLGVHPPPRILWVAAGQLGQRLFDPPSVRGWEGGMAWMTSSSLLERGNVMGMLLGVVDVNDVITPEILALGVYAHTMGNNTPPGSHEQVDETMNGNESLADERLVPGPRSLAQGKSQGSVADGRIVRAPQFDPPGGGDGTRAGVEHAADDSRVDARKSDPFEPAEDPVARDSSAESSRHQETLAVSDHAISKRARSEPFWSRINLTVRCRQRAAVTDEEIVDTLCNELLAVDVTQGGRATLIYFLRGERTALGVQGGDLIDDEETSEQLLRRLSHLILSLPEAQLL